MITRESILSLHEKAAEVSLSIYLPTHRTEPDIQQDLIRFKNLLKEVENKLSAVNAESNTKDSILKKAYTLLDDTQFWRQNEEGLAVFITDEFMDFYKVPVKFEERVLVDNCFLITPLIRMITLEGTFCVLALSQKKTRLLKCTQQLVEPIELHEAPESMEEFRQFDVYQKSIQQHSGQGKGTPIFHGHGGGDDNDKVMTEYLKTIENEVTSIMRKRNDPLILAGVESAVSHYKKVNHYSRVMDMSITANPDPLSDETLRDEAWTHIQTYFLKDMYKDLEQLGDLTGSDKISRDLNEILNGAYYGKVASLFLPNSLQKWGVFNPDNQPDAESQYNGEERDLINLAALFTLEKGGNVYAFGDNEMPIKSEVAAIYRYS